MCSGFTRPLGVGERSPLFARRGLFSNLRHVLHGQHNNKATTGMLRSIPSYRLTGSSGAGTTSVRRTFEQIFRREKITAVFIEGDAFHRFNREEMKQAAAEAAKNGNPHLSHFGEMRTCSRARTPVQDYGEIGTGRARHYVHDQREAELYGSTPGTFTPVGRGALRHGTS